MAGDAERPIAEQPARRRVIAVALAEMRTIAAERDRQRRVVVQQEGDVARVADGHQRLCRALHVVAGRADRGRLLGRGWAAR